MTANQHVLGIEYLALESRGDVQSGVATYGFDLRPEFVDPEQFWVAIYRASEIRAAGAGVSPPGWVGEYPSDEYEADEPHPYVCAIEDTDARPEGAPLRVTVSLPFLEPRYDDAWVAFVLEQAEVPA